MSKYSDTIQYVKFFNLMYESAGVPTGLKLQYQYQYTINPIWTEEDVEKGRAPAGLTTNDFLANAALAQIPTAQQKRSAWINLGPSVGFGENTGWQVVPVKRTAYLSQGSVRVDYRIVVTSGGVPGTNMNADNVLLARITRPATGALTAYSDWWTADTGRWRYHFFAGYRDGGAPGVGVAQYGQK
jgi:hypothetical protein